MTSAWFEDLPLDWTRSDLRAAASALETGYPTSGDITFLAKSAGLAVAALDLNGSTRMIVREVLNKARASGRLEQLLFEVFADPGVEAIHDALRSTLEGHEARIQAAALERRPSLEVLGRLPADVSVRGESGPETLLNAMAPFDNPALFRARLATSELRVCQIVVDGTPAGSGFLVGGQYILTNWHVVHGLAEKAGDGGAAVFDHKRTPGGSVASPGRAVSFAHEWNVAHSEYASDVVENSPAGPTSDYCDYALVRLSEPVGAQGIGPEGTGDERGWFSLGSRVTPPSADEPLWILGHPSDLPLQLSYASPAGAVLAGNGTRLRYRVNTENGSSGSVVLDRNFEAIALHHYGGAATNQGVPISLIVSDLRAKLTGSPLLVDLGL